MNYLIAIIIAMLVSSAAGVLLAAIAAILNASDVMEKEQEDLEQEAYIREWKKAREQEGKACVTGTNTGFIS